MHKKENFIHSTGFIHLYAQFYRLAFYASTGCGFDWWVSAAVFTLSPGHARQAKSRTAVLLGTSALAGELDLVLVLDQVCDSSTAGSQVGFGSPMHLSCAPFLDRISTFGLLGTSVRAESRHVFWRYGWMTTESILLFFDWPPEQSLNLRLNRCCYALQGCQDWVLFRCYWLKCFCKIFVARDNASVKVYTWSCLHWFVLL